MKKIYQNIIYALMILQIFWPYLTYAEPRAVDDPSDHYPEFDDYDQYFSEDYDSLGENDEVDPVADPYVEPSTYEEMEYFDTAETEDFSADDVQGAEPISPEELAPLTPSKYVTKDNKRIILSHTDEKKLNQLRVANSVIPSLFSDMEELSALSDYSIDELYQMQEERPEEYYNLVKKEKSKTKNNEYIKKRLLSNPIKLAEFFDIEVGEAVEKLESEKDFLGEKILSTLNNTIDRRVIATLAYLITPKNMGGSRPLQN